jgi:5'-nucleotidase
VNQPLRILLTNDDGVDAPGLAVLQQIAHALSDDVWTVAPAGNQSGAGHRLSFAREMEAEQRADRIYAIAGGSPADCVTFGMTYLLGSQKADVVLSGVNNGQNLGDIIHCSGTAAGAREGAMQGAIGIALSQAVDYAAGHGVLWHNAEAFGASVIRQLIDSAPGRHTYFNVNFPLGEPEAVSDVRVVRHQRFAHSPFAHYPSDNPGKFFIAIPKTPLPLDPECDFEVLHKDRAITVTPLMLEQTDAAVLARMDGSLRLDRSSEA